MSKDQNWKSHMPLLLPLAVAQAPENAASLGTRASKDKAMQRVCSTKEDDCDCVPAARHPASSRTQCTTHRQPSN